MGRIGLQELIVIFFVILILFGAKKLPEIGSSLGRAIREFRKAAKESGDEIKSAAKSNDEKE